MFRVKIKGDFTKTEGFLYNITHMKLHQLLKRYGEEGVRALEEATPVDTGETASSWGYEIVTDRTSSRVVWTNSKIVDGYPIALLIQLGHGTRNGGYVEGIDYINPALKTIFMRMADDAWREVTSA